MRANYVATALCVLCVFGSALASQQKMFAELMHEVKAGVSSRPSGEDGHVDYKHLCMREARHYNCRTSGCQDIRRCSAAGCRDCVTGIVFQSDVSCCANNHEYDYDYYSSAGNSIAAGGTGFNSPYLRIGTCDWDITVSKNYDCLFTDNNCNNTQAASGTVAASMMKRVGTAFATCYLTSGAEYCDEMLCDKMVLRFQGGFYITGAQSYEKRALDQTATTLNLTDVWCGPSLYDAYGNQNITDNQKPYTGVALLASGTVSLSSLRKEVEYPVGHMDYVYDFIEFSETAIETRFGLSSGDYPYLTPNTYKMKLVGEKKATYKK